MRPFAKMTVACAKVTRRRTFLRHMALNLLGQERSAKCGVKAKRLKAGWNEAYLSKVLTGS